jgi:glycosyltransferase involved in cell wall biosynthesis
MTGKRRVLSIGLPVYNSERYLRASLDSLRAQRFSDFELIVSDNASTDGTEQICREYERLDPRLRYYRSPVNVGAPQNYRRVFDLSSGEYFKWHTSDDLVAPDFLSRCMDAITADPGIVLAYTKSQLVDENGLYLADVEQDIALASSSPSARFRQVHGNLGFCNVIYGVARRDILERTRGLGAYINSDRVLIAELALYGRLHEVAEVLFSRRMHGGAYSGQQSVEARLRFYNPQKRRRVALMNTRSLWEYGRAVRRSPVSIGEKLRLGGYLLRVMNWQRHDLAQEMWAAGVSAAGQIVRTGDGR